MRFEENARVPSSGMGAGSVGFAGNGAPLAELLALLGQGLRDAPAEARVGLEGVLKKCLEEHEGEVGCGSLGSRGEPGRRPDAGRRPALLCGDRRRGQEGVCGAGEGAALREQVRYALAAVSPVEFAGMFLEFEPHEGQERVLDKLPDFRQAALNCSRQWGKSSVGAVWALQKMIFTPPAVGVLDADEQEAVGAGAVDARGGLRL